MRTTGQKPRDHLKSYGSQAVQACLLVRFLWTSALQDRHARGSDPRRIRHGYSCSVPANRCKYELEESLALVGSPQHRKTRTFARLVGVSSSSASTSKLRCKTEQVNSQFFSNVLPGKGIRIYGRMVCAMYRPKCYLGASGVCSQVTLVRAELIHVLTCD